MAVAVLDVVEQARAELIKLEEEKVEKGGFERGVIKPRLEAIAEKYDLNYLKVKNLYYQQVKDSVEETKGDNVGGQEVEENLATNTHNTLLLDGKEIRYTQKQKTYFPLNDILSYLSASRATKTVKEIVDSETEEKEYLNFKNGYNTLVIDANKLKKLLNEFMITGTFEMQTKSNKLYGFLKEEGLFEEEENSEYSSENEKEHTEDPLEETRTQKEDVLNTYLIGSHVEVVVQRILHYGLIVETTDGTTTTGLIHISEIKDSYVDNLPGSNLFKIGDVLNARVKGLDKEKGNLSLSTKKLSLIPLRNIYLNVNDKEEYKKHENPPINLISDKISSADLHHLFQKEMEEIPAEKEDMLVGQTMESIAEHTTKAIDDEEIKEMISFLNGVVGALSPKAKEKLEELTSKHLIFKVTMKMMKVSQGFENDLGLMFLKEVEKELGDSL